MDNFPSHKTNQLHQVLLQLLDMMVLLIVVWVAVFKIFKGKRQTLKNALSKFC